MKKAMCWMIIMTILFVTGCSNEPFAVPGQDEKDRAEADIVIVGNDTEMEPSPYLDETTAEEKEPQHNSMLLTAQIGDVITFGRYEQDNNTENGPEELKWIVLDTNGSDILVISEQIIDAIVYIYMSTDPNRSTTWESSYIREWLNDDFYETGFTAIEQHHIAVTTVENEHLETTDKKYLIYPFKSGNNTQDRIFLISLDELLQYFPERADRVCTETEYAAEKRIKDKSQFWMLRTPVEGTYILTVMDKGAINGYIGMRLGIRPAMWLHRI